MRRNNLQLLIQQSIKQGKLFDSEVGAYVGPSLNNDRLCHAQKLE